MRGWSPRVLARRRPRIDPAADLADTTTTSRHDHHDHHDRRPRRCPPIRGDDSSHHRRHRAHHRRHHRGRRLRPGLGEWRGPRLHAHRPDPQGHRHPGREPRPRSRRRARRQRLRLAGIDNSPRSPPRTSRSRPTRSCPPSSRSPQVGTTSSATWRRRRPDGAPAPTGFARSRPSRPTPTPAPSPSWPAAAHHRLPRLGAADRPPPPDTAVERSSAKMRRLPPIRRRCCVEAWKALDLPITRPEDFGSNGWAIGADRVEGATGSVLLANPTSRGGRAPLQRDATDRPRRVRRLRRTTARRARHRHRLHRRRLVDAHDLRRQADDRLRPHPRSRLTDVVPRRRRVDSRCVDRRRPSTSCAPTAPSTPRPARCGAATTARSSTSRHRLDRDQRVTYRDANIDNDEFIEQYPGCHGSRASPTCRH